MRVAMNVIAILAFGGAQAFAATTGLDMRFGTGGMVLIGPTARGQRIFGISAVAVQGDGKILVAGFSEGGPGPGVGSRLAAVGRFKADGSWDTTFADKGLFVLPYAVPPALYGGNLLTVALLSDGSILASGGANNGAGPFQYNSCTLLLKLTSVGILDTNFANDHSGSFCFDLGTVNNTYFSHFDAIVIDSDDTWYLTSPSSNMSHGAVAHFNAAGALMPSYGSNGIASLSYGVFGLQLRIQPDHSLIVASVYSSSGGEGVAVSRLKSSGFIDTQYGSVGNYAVDFQAGGYTLVNYIALDAQGRSLVTIDAQIPGNYLPYRFARVTPAGTADPSFNGNGQQPGYPGFAIPTVSSDASADYLVAAQPLADGHIFAIGDAGAVAASDGATNIALLRLNDDSSYDTSFGDATHLGWASLHIGASGTSNAYARALVFDDAGHAFIAIDAADINNNGCNGIIRAIPDQLFSDSFDPASPVPTCPQ